MSVSAPTYKQKVDPAELKLCTYWITRWEEVIQAPYPSGAKKSFIYLWDGDQYSKKVPQTTHPYSDINLTKFRSE